MSTQRVRMIPLCRSRGPQCQWDGVKDINDIFLTHEPGRGGARGWAGRWHAPCGVAASATYLSTRRSDLRDSVWVSHQVEASVRSQRVRGHAQTRRAHHPTTGLTKHTTSPFRPATPLKKSPRGWPQGIRLPWGVCGIRFKPFDPYTGTWGVGGFSATGGGGTGHGGFNRRSRTPPSAPP